MSDKSERAYLWIGDKAERAGRWLDKNIGRVLFAAGAAGLSIYGYQQPDGTFLNNISAELFGIVLTAVIIDYVNERRQTEQLKAQLVRQMGMNIRAVAVPAARELAYHGWLYDGSMTNAYLWGADLSGADLRGANLSRAGLWGADLSGADLRGANLSRAQLNQGNLSGAIFENANLSNAGLAEADLSGANLRGANLSKVSLSKADLSKADLSEADLSGASLREADLSGVDLRFVNLSGADLWEANLSGAILTGANLSRVNLSGANLSGVDLWRSNLSGATNWNVEQLDKAVRHTLTGVIMPDNVRLKLADAWWEEPFIKIEGPNFEEWRAQYLAKQAAERYDDPQKLDHELKWIQLESGSAWRQSSGQETQTVQQSVQVYRCLGSGQRNQDRQPDRRRVQRPSQPGQRVEEAVVG